MFKAVHHVIWIVFHVSDVVSAQDSDDEEDDYAPELSLEVIPTTYEKTLSGTICLIMKLQNSYLCTHKDGYGKNCLIKLLVFRHITP